MRRSRERGEWSCDSGGRGARETEEVGSFIELATAACFVSQASPSRHGFRVDPGGPTLKQSQFVRADAETESRRPMRLCFRVAPSDVTLFQSRVGRPDFKRKPRRTTWRSFIATSDDAT